MSIIRLRFKNLIDYCLPPRCIICANTIKSVKCSIHICADCNTILPWLTTCCKICANQLPETTIGIKICGQCLKQPPLFQKSTCLFIYKNPARKLITQLKFQHRLLLAKHFGNLLVEKLALNYSGSLPDILMPVPLHPTRLRQRGFNQALEIAKHINRQLKITIDKKSLVRCRPTLPQTTIPAKKRFSNVKNAFACSSNLENLHVLLIDDVITTGHTIHACCNALQKAGVRKIDVCAVARTTF